MASRLPLLILIVLVVVGGSWLLKQKKQKEDPRIAPAEAELSDADSSHFTEHTFKVLGDMCTVEFSSTESPFTRWRLSLNRPDFSFVVGGEALRFRGGKGLGNPAIQRTWLPADGPEKKELSFPVVEVEIPYRADGGAMLWIGAFSRLADLCRPETETVSK